MAAGERRAWSKFSLWFTMVTSQTRRAGYVLVGPQKGTYRLGKENVMGNKWVWKTIMIPACLVLIFGLWGIFYPDNFMNFYLMQVSNTALDSFSLTQPEISKLLEVIFRANGLGMTMSGILSIFIILFAFRKGEKWSIPALAIAGGIGLVGEIILEIMVL